MTFGEFFLMIIAGTFFGIWCGYRAVKKKAVDLLGSEKARELGKAAAVELFKRLRR